MIKLPKGKVAMVPMFDPDTTDSGLLYVPDIAKERCDQGIVKYIADDCKVDFKVGDHVVFSGWDGTLLTIQDEGQLIIMKATSIKAVLEYPSTTPIAGLYLKMIDGSYENATYEQAMNFITRVINNNGRYLTIKAGPETAEEVEK